MSSQIKIWADLKDADSHQVEEVLRGTFPNSDAYRYNSASIRVRIIDDLFRGLRHTKRVSRVEPLLEKLPLNLQAEIFNLLLLYDGECEQSLYCWNLNLEFKNPQSSDL